MKLWKGYKDLARVKSYYESKHMFDSEANLTKLQVLACRVLCVHQRHCNGNVHFHSLSLTWCLPLSWRFFQSFEFCWFLKQCENTCESFGIPETRPNRIGTSAPHALWENKYTNQFPDSAVEVIHRNVGIQLFDVGVSSVRWIERKYPYLVRILMEIPLKTVMSVRNTWDW